MDKTVFKGFRLSPQQRRLWPLQEESPVYLAQAVLVIESDLNRSCSAALWRARCRNTRSSAPPTSACQGWRHRSRSPGALRAFRRSAARPAGGCDGGLGRRESGRPRGGGGAAGAFRLGGLPGLRDLHFGLDRASEGGDNPPPVHGEPGRRRRRRSSSPRFWLSCGSPVLTAQTRASSSGVQPARTSFTLCRRSVPSWDQCPSR